MKPLMQSLPSQHGEQTESKVDYILKQINADVRESLTPEQLSEVRSMVRSSILQSSPKLVDLRVNVDLIFTRFYVVLFVGKERRKNHRAHTVSGITVITNKVAAIGLLIGLNLTVSVFIFLLAYLIKSALGINLLAHHLNDYLG
jgi:hypothetical protein